MDSSDDDDDMAAKPFNYEIYDKFCKSFNSNVANSVGGTMGELYKGTYGGILKVFVDGDKVEGTAFVIRKTRHVSILLTCSHIFCDWEPSQSVEVVSSDFKYFKAMVGHRSFDMDICLLIVKEDLGSNVLELKTWCDEVNFGEDIFSISCPRFEMRVDKTGPPQGFEERFLHTLWFTMSRGYVAHPFLVGIHLKNLDGTYIQLQGCTWGSGGSGAPIFNSNGNVIGLYISSTSDDSDSSYLNHWALRLNSVRDYLERLEGVSQGGNNLREVVWSWWKHTQLKAGKGLKLKLSSWRTRGPTRKRSP